MINENNLWLLGVVVLLFLVSAWFSGSETAMMSLNRYRLRHQARKGDLKAARLLSLLKRPDRLLGVVLIGNTFANIFVSSLVTLLVAKAYGESGVFPATLILTVLILIFAETAPKTVAALHPARFARGVGFALACLLRLLYPLVWLVNCLANGFLRLFGIRMHGKENEALSNEELGTVVREASGQLSDQYQDMLLSILGLEQIEVDDIIVPRNEIVGIDITEPWGQIVAQLKTVSHSHLPVYREHINQVVGILRVQDLVGALVDKVLTKDVFIEQLRDVYYIPEAAQLSQQLIYFQKENEHLGMVVDEYGDIQGLITLQDILEEIVGQFAGTLGSVGKKVVKQSDGSYIVEASIALRDFNRQVGWELPVEGPNTLSGLIIDELESIPLGPMTLTIKGHRIEIKAIDGTTIDRVQIWPEAVVVGSDDAK